MSTNTNVRNFQIGTEQGASTSVMLVGSHFGEVLSNVNCNYSIEFPGMMRTAIQATSCLVKPKVGDYVACLSDGKRVFVSAVLERGAKDIPIEIKLDDPVRLSAPDITIMGTEDLALTSQNGELNFSELSLRTMKLEVSADEATTSIKTLTHIGKAIKTTLSEILLRAAMSLRIIDGADHQRSNEAYITAEKFLSVRGEMTSIAAKKDVKIDGTRVHIG